MEELTTAILDGNIEAITNLLHPSTISTFKKNEVEKLFKLSKNKGISQIEALLLIYFQNMISLYTQKEKEILIIELLSQFSQDTYASNWQNNIEYDVWNWANKLSKPPEYFVEKSVVTDSKIILEVGNLIQLWAIWDTTNKKPIPISLNQWIKKIEL